MSVFEETKKYVPKEETFFDDGRETQLLHSIYRNPDINTLRNNPGAILHQIDTYARNHKYLMNVGSAKGAIVSELITREQPRTMVELGGYVGYSTILFSSAMKMANQPSSRDSQRPRYFCLERNPEFAAVIGSLIDLAGLKDVVEIVVGPSDTSIQRLWREGIFADGIDLMFLDHYKPAYTMDLKLCEELGLVKPGRTVLAADNVVFPGNPTYLEYVRSSVAEKRAALKASTTTQQEGIANASGVDQRFLERTAKQYERREGESKLNTSLKGNPDLVYESRLVESFEPTGDPDGVEITRCIREDSS